MGDIGQDSYGEEGRWERQRWREKRSGKGREKIVMERGNRDRLDRRKQILVEGSSGEGRERTEDKCRAKEGRERN